MDAVKEPIVIKNESTGERWEIAPDDPLYEPISSGALIVTPEDIEAVRKWWYTKAEEIVRQNFKNIPWNDLKVTVKDVQSASLTNLSEKLAIIAYYLGVVIQEKSMLESSLSLVKKAFEQSLEKKMMNSEYSGTKANKRIKILDDNPILKLAMIDIWEKEAIIKGLEGIEQRLDLMWRTTSRIITARLKEPLD